MLVREDVPRSRATTLFRFFLAIPHLLWISLWGLGMFCLLPVWWLMVLITATPDRGLHDAYASYLRYTLHVYAYLMLAAEPYPGFLGRPGTYPIDLAVPPPARQNRWTVGFRVVLAFPAYLFMAALGSGVVNLGTFSYLSFSAGLAITIAWLAWFAILATGRMPAGMRDALLWTLGYAMQATAYFFLLTGAYPNADPRAVPLRPRPRHPIRLADTDEPRRHRLLVAFRGPLSVPHLAWTTLWGVAALLAAFAAWCAGIALGRVPGPLHRFLAAYVRYCTHAYAFAYLAGGPFPGFTGTAGSYPVDIEIDGPAAQGRWSIAFRWVLAFPALLLAASMSGILFAASIGAWFHALFRGRMPGGLHAALVYAIRYSAMAYAHALLVTGTYPHSGPSEAGPPQFLTAPENPLA